MALFFEDASKVTKKQIYIPNNAKKVFKAMGDIYKPYICPLYTSDAADELKRLSIRCMHLMQKKKYDNR